MATEQVTAEQLCGLHIGRKLRLELPTWGAVEARIQSVSHEFHLRDEVGHNVYVRLSDAPESALRVLTSYPQLTLAPGDAVELVEP